MHFPAALLVALLTAAAPPEGPILAGSNATLGKAPAQKPLLVFKGALLLNEFVYRAVLALPPDAKASPQLAKTVAAQLATFLRESGYDLAKVRAHVEGEQIEVQLDEGALDKIIVVGGGWLTALRLRASLDLPADVFNRRAFEAQMPQLANKFGLHAWSYELWPVHLLDTEGSLQLDEVEELRAVPLIRPARGYELRIFPKSEPWASGFAPEVQVNGQIGLGLGGRYRGKDAFQDGDRWQMHFRVGGAMRSSLDDSSSQLVNSADYVSARWLSKPWNDSSSGLRMTVVGRGELWWLQRRDLMVERYRIGTAEAGTGTGAQLTPEYALFFTAGLQRRWYFDVQPAAGTSLLPDAAAVPTACNRAFLRLNTSYTFNPRELRQDERNTLSAELSAYRPLKGDRGFFRVDLQGRRIFPIGWHELRVGAGFALAAGDVYYTDEIPLSDPLRIGFGIDKYTHRIGSLNLEFRYSLLRDKVKVGVFNDLGVWRHLPRDDPGQRPEVSGSSGAGLFLFLLDEFQADLFYGAGWSSDGPVHTGLALQIREAF